MPSKKDKLKSEVEASTRGFAFDALIGTLSKSADPQEKEQPPPTEEPQKQEAVTGPAEEEKSDKGRQITEPLGAKTTTAKRTVVKNTIVDSTIVNNTVVEIASNYCRLDLDVSDRLAALQTPAEQSIYNRLYRLSYGEGRTSCSVGMTRLVEATGIRSPKTIAKAIGGLVQKGHIAILDAHHNDPKRGTTYQVFLPGEVNGIKSKTKIKTTGV